MAKVYAFVADGMEEVECLAVCDCLRRAKVDVKLVSIMGRKMVTGSHGFKIEADSLFEEITDDADVYFCHLKLLTFLCQSASGSFPEVTARFSHHPYTNKIFHSDNIRVPVHLPIFSHPFRGHLQRPALKQTA